MLTELSMQALFFLVSDFPPHISHSMILLWDATSCDMIDGPYVSVSFFKFKNKSLGTYWSDD